MARPAIVGLAHFQHRICSTKLFKYHRNWPCFYATICGSFYLTTPNKTVLCLWSIVSNLNWKETQMSSKTSLNLLLSVLAHRNTQVNQYPQNEGTLEQLRYWKCTGPSFKRISLALKSRSGTVRLKHTLKVYNTIIIWSHYQVSTTRPL